MNGPTDGDPAVPPDVLRRCLDVLSRAPAGLVTDIDGTISAIAPTPAEAVVAEGAREALARLTARLAFVGVVTGRSAAVAETMVGVPGLTYVGNHGMERRQAGIDWSHPGALAASEAMRTALREFAAKAEAVGQTDGLVIEDKRLSGSIHYRLAPDPDAARAALLPLAVAVAQRHGLIVTEGRLIFEVRPSVVVNKGTAIVDLVAEHRLRGVIFLGDDLTDVDGFRALRVLRDSGEVATLRVGVLAPETQPQVLEESDVTVYGVVSCVALLGAIADTLDSPGDVAPTPEDQSGAASR